MVVNTFDKIDKGYQYTSRINSHKQLKLRLLIDEEDESGLIGCLNAVVVPQNGDKPNPSKQEIYNVPIKIKKDEIDSLITNWKRYIAFYTLTASDTYDSERIKNFF